MMSPPVMAMVMVMMMMWVNVEVVVSSASGSWGGVDDLTTRLVQSLVLTIRREQPTVRTITIIRSGLLTYF